MNRKLTLSAFVSFCLFAFLAKAEMPSGKVFFSDGKDLVCKNMKNGLGDKTRPCCRLFFNYRRYFCCFRRRRNTGMD